MGYDMNFHAVVTFKVVFKIDLNMLCPVTEKMQIIHSYTKENKTKDGSIIHK